MTSAFARLLDQAPRLRIARALVLMLLASATDGIGLFLLLPLLEILGESDGSVTSGIFRSVFHTAGLPMTIESLLAVFVILIAIRSLIQYWRDRESLALQLLLVNNLRVKTLRALLRADWSKVGSLSVAGHVNVIGAGMDHVSAGLQQGLTMVASLATVGVHVVVAASLAPGMTALVAGCAFVLFAATWQRDRRAMIRAREQIGHGQAMHVSLLDSLFGLKTCKFLGVAQQQASIFEADLQRLGERRIATAQALSLNRHLSIVLGAAILATVMIVAVRGLALPKAELFAFALIFARLFPMLVQTRHLFNNVVQAAPSLVEIETQLRLFQAEAEPDTSGFALLEPAQVIEIKDVIFFPTGAQTPILDGVSLRLPVRTTTVISGPSGAGKSTMADIFTGLLKPTSGHLQLDGKQLDDRSRVAWRAHVAYVPQEAYFFQGSIRSNLQLADPDADEAALVRALRRAVAEFVLNLPDGLDTPMGDGGRNFSVGERQRISVARALLKRPDLLVLDEADSALDPDSTNALSQTIESLHGELTLLVISHRKFAERFADQAAELRNGKIQVYDTHADADAK